MRRALVIARSPRSRCPRRPHAQATASRSWAAARSTPRRCSGPGTYADTVAAGETVYWKVKLAKGQVLKVKATVDIVPDRDRLRRPTTTPGSPDLDYYLDIFRPLREPISEELGAGYEQASATLEGDDSAGAKTGDGRRARACSASSRSWPATTTSRSSRRPGEWYIGLSVADTSNEPAEQPVELPVDLKITVEGTAEASSPDFAKAPRHAHAGIDRGPGRACSAASDRTPATRP